MEPQFIEDNVYNQYAKARNLILETSKKAAQLILQNGGETYRAEDTCRRICICYGAEKADVLAVTTGIIITVEFASLRDEPNHVSTAVVRVPFRTTDLEAVNRVNDISRKLTAGKMRLDDAEKEFDEMLAKFDAPAKMQPLSVMKDAAAAGLAAAFFCVMFGGGWLEFAASLLAGALASLVSNAWTRFHLHNFIGVLISSFITASVVMSFTFVASGFDHGCAITGAIMPLVPGVAITNAVRDTISGDLISGSARLIEAFLTAVAIAVGVGFVMTLFMMGGLI